ncbi:hypothetical protein TNIN_323671 [Trichonephila inaurata madagascariensis]|uniref:Uncharacterized protein n=1 Tax=Trichonephila inaurata madagascariensis TaxID=2747483 RepID=A0A8X6IUX4_9ARAC|nr:hypothetical protein TNIN_323671 [Trichonephila inaurata madagascariensis]
MNMTQLLWRWSSKEPTTRIVWKKAVSEFGNLPYCDTPGCPIHETPTSSPVKTLPTKRKDEDGYTSPPPSKISKNNVSHQENFKLNLTNRFKNLQSQDTETAGTSRTINAKNTTLQPKANPASQNLPSPAFLVITENHRSQLKILDDIYPDLRSKLTDSTTNYTRTIYAHPTDQQYTESPPPIQTKKSKTLTFLLDIRIEKVSVPYGRILNYEMTPLYTNYV